MDITKNLNNYADKFSLSQVINFFERHGIKFTKTMIQNYVRVGVLPPLAGRYYGKNHLVFLAWTNTLKSSLGLREIGELFLPLYDLQPGELIEVYKLYLILKKETDEQVRALKESVKKKTAEEIGVPEYAEEIGEVLAGIVLGGIKSTG